jgi:hypothetical protein
MNQFFFLNTDGSLTALTQEALCPNGEFKQVRYVQCTIGQYVISRNTIPLVTVVIVATSESKAMLRIEKRIQELGVKLFPHLDGAVFLLVEGSVTNGTIIDFQPSLYLAFVSARKPGIVSIWSSLGAQLGYHEDFTVRYFWP